MKVISVNVGAKSPLVVGGKEIQTGIFKRPVDHDVEVKRLGITGDNILDRKHHGGPDQALYLYRTEDYEFWSEKLGKALAPGDFGENLTVSGIPTPALMVGDRLTSSRLVLEVAAPRIPCNVFAAKMGDPGFLKTFMQEARSGFYVRVIKEGLVASGDEFEITTRDQSISTVEMFRDMKRQLDKDTLKRYLDLPIDARTRKDFTERLSKLNE